MLRSQTIKTMAADGEDDDGDRHALANRSANGRRDIASHQLALVSSATLERRRRPHASKIARLVSMTDYKYEQKKKITHLIFASACNGRFSFNDAFCCCCWRKERRHALEGCKRLLDDLDIFLRRLLFGDDSPCLAGARHLIFLATFPLPHLFFCSHIWRQRPRGGV